MAIFNNPLEIARELRQTVIGQTLGIMKMSVAAYDHSVRIANIEARSHLTNAQAQVEIAKSNVLLLGPTGSGKTLLAQALARILQVPFAMADATTLTEAGYVGEDVENIVLKLLMAAGHDVEKAQRGIIYIDEIDKIGMKGENPSITRDVSGEGVQQGLLKLVEGTTASLPPAGGRKHPQTEFVQVDTTNILFIAGGAFSGLDKIVQKRLSANQTGIGFGATLRDPEAEREAQKNICELATAEDLVKFGLIPELVGRFPVLTGLRELTVEQLVDILTRPRNAIVSQQIALAKADMSSPMVLSFEPDALLAIAEESYRLGTGARGLRSIIEETLLPVKFERPPSIRISRVQVEKRQEQLLDAAARLDEKMDEPAPKKKKAA